jgi:putative intracellular protease/amidase
MSTTAVRTVHVAVYDTLTDWEVGYATAHINNGNWQRQPGAARVVYVGASRDPITTMGGARVIPDVTLDELVPAASAMLILPGADTWLGGGNVEFAEKARQFLASGVPVAAICGATAGLARAGLLDERDHTSAAAEYLAATGYAGGERYVDERAVVSGDLITAGPQSPVQFARATLERLDLASERTLDAYEAVFHRADPSGFPVLMQAP